MDIFGNTKIYGGERRTYGSAGRNNHPSSMSTKVHKPMLQVCSKTTQ